MLDDPTAQEGDERGRRDGEEHRHPGLRALLSPLWDTGYEILCLASTPATVRRSS